MYENLTTFISGITVIFGILGIFLFIRLFSTWNKIDLNLIKARVFLADKFVMKNIFVIFIAGMLIAIHNFIEYLGLAFPDFYYGYISNHFPVRLFAVTELLIALFLIEWLMYEWIKIAKK
jgi:hypothetical protein